MTTNTIAIDDLLAKVSPELVQMYRAINIPGGPNLSELNEEYKGMKDPSTFVLHVALAIFVLMLIGIAGSIVLMLCGKLVPVCLMPALPAIVLMVVVFFPLKKRTERDLKRLRFLTSILEGFRNDMDALNCAGTMVDIFTVDSVRMMFVVKATEVLEAEAVYNKVCKSDKSTAEEVWISAARLISSRRELHLAIAIAEKKFGLKYNNSEIFTAAAKRLPCS
jgi:hypothetical protein